MTTRVKRPTNATLHDPAVAMGVLMLHSLAANVADEAWGKLDAATDMVPLDTLRRASKRIAALLSRLDLAIKKRTNPKRRRCR